MHQTVFRLAAAICLLALIEPSPTASQEGDGCVDTCTADRCFETNQTLGGERKFFYSQNSTPCYQVMRSPTSTTTNCLGTTTLLVKRHTGTSPCNDLSAAGFRVGTCSEHPTEEPEFYEGCCQTCTRSGI
jgi:hypothetical protein